MRQSSLLVGLILVAAPAALLAANAADVDGATPTFYKDVVPILQESCQDCHRTNGKNLGGMVAPMALVSYDEVRPWAKSIAKVTKTKTMPPWHAAPSHAGQFEAERTLSDSQIDTLVRWASTGATPGEATDAPPAREFVGSESGWSIGEPDLVLTFDEPYLVKDEIEDEYVYIKVDIPEALMAEDRWIKAVEFRPGSEVVHHIIARPLGGIAPGNQPSVYPEGVSQLLRKGTTVYFQMHYHKEAGPGTAVADRSSVAVRFYEPGEEIKYVVNGDGLGNVRFRIPAGEANYSAKSEYTFPEDAQVLAFTPHMHLRGKAAKYVAYFPDGREQVLLDVPSYDFNWQTNYRYREPVSVPAGTRIETTFWWDNSASNPSNPDPTIDVTFGRPTTAEMGFGFLSYLDSEPRSIIAGQPIPEDVLERYNREDAARNRGNRRPSTVESSSGQ
jgi:mono/diheme cytochrome c family protein